MLTFIVFFPVAGALAIATLPRADESRAKHIAALVTATVFVMAIVAFAAFDKDTTGFQFTERFRWVRATDAGFDVQYFLGIDGLSLVMVLLTGLLFPLAVLVSWRIELRPKEYFAWLLVLETGVMGVFSSLDLILFFLFWEVELVPMYMLISIWGTGRKEYSATKFVIYNCRQRPHAGGYPRTRLLRRPSDLRHDAPDGSKYPGHAPAPAGDILPHLRRLRRKAAGLPLPHLAPGRPH
jgi:NADH-quinone oxidoreductase subunit M